MTSPVGRRAWRRSGDEGYDLGTSIRPYTKLLRASKIATISEASRAGSL